MDVLSALSAARLVPVVVLDDAAAADGLAAALVAGGLPVAEVTFRTAAAQDSIRAMAARGDILVGAGTVLTPEQVDQAVAAGARFVVSPGLSRAVVERAHEHGVLVLRSGCGVRAARHNQRPRGTFPALHDTGRALRTRTGSSPALHQESG